MATGITTGKRLERVNSMLGLPQKSVHSQFVEGVKTEAEEAARRESVQASLIKEIESQAKAADASLIAAQVLRDSVAKDIKAANAARDKANVSRETSEKQSAKIKTGLETKINTLTQTIEKMQKEINALHSGRSDKLEAAKANNKTINTQVRDLEKKNSKLQGQLEQARQKKSAAKPIQPTPAVIPSFEVTPIRDAAGNLINATFKPIGGN